MSLQDTPIHQHYADGDTIVTEGIMSNNAYVILKGKVRVTKKIDKNKTYFLCGCFRTKNRPFCDRSHEKIKKS